MMVEMIVLVSGVGRLETEDDRSEGMKRYMGPGGDHGQVLFDYEETELLQRLLAKERKLNERRLEDRRSTGKTTRRWAVDRRQA